MVVDAVYGLSQRVLHGSMQKCGAVVVLVLGHAVVLVAGQAAADHILEKLLPI
jgi:hypothetical protein